jgi:signal transduction histidine kinase
VQQALNDELQAQAARLEETMAELESSNDELEMQRTQLEELNLALEARTAEVETANRAKTDFLTAMSHELRTPLNAIAGYADLMEMEVPGPLTEGQRTALARIRHNEQHLLSLINDVLNYARLERGKIELHLADLPVDEVLREIGEMMEPLVEARGLALAVETCDAAVHARGDRDRVAQILLNLLSNAVKCTEAGGVRVWANAGADGVRIHVRDTGRGIAADKHEAIFDPFVQLAPEKTLTDGVGLGLSISRQLAREMHGDLSVESAPGEGATFTLTLPPARRIPAQKIVEPPAVTEDEAVAG